MDGLKFVITVKPGNDATTEYMTNEKFSKDGIECDGYLLVGFKDGSAKFGSLMNLTLEEIMEYLRDDSDIGGNIMQAAMIANGYHGAFAIQERCKREKTRKEGLKAFADLIFGGKEQE